MQLFKNKYVVILLVSLITLVCYQVLVNGKPLAYISVSVKFEENHLVVGFSGLAKVDDRLPRLVGYYKYVAKGEEIRKEFDIEGGYAWNFSGAYITEVQVQNIAGAGYYQLFVSENHKSLYASKSIIEDDRVVVYKRNENL